MTCSTSPWFTLEVMGLLVETRERSFDSSSLSGIAHYRLFCTSVILGT